MYINIYPDLNSVYPYTLCLYSPALPLNAEELSRDRVRVNQTWDKVAAKHMVNQTWDMVVAKHMVNQTWDKVAAKHILESNGGMLKTGK